jgi:hypothetical protein
MSTMTSIKNTESEKPTVKDLTTSFENTWLELVTFHTNKMDYHCTQYNYLTEHRQVLKKSNKELYRKVRKEQYKKYTMHRRFLILLSGY